MQLPNKFALWLGVAVVLMAGAFWLRQAVISTPPPRHSAQENTIETPSRLTTERRQSTERPPAPELLPQGFVGSDTCGTCHRDRFDSYQETDHSRSLRRVDDVDLNTDVKVAHDLSNRLFEVYQKNSQTWHKQILLPAPTDRDPKKPERRLEAGDYPIEFVMGSGHFAQAFLLRDQGFLLQSPLAFYTAPQAYEMSPGYDVPHHLGMTRVIDDDCLFCHVGSLKKSSDPFRPVINELSIGCERCHGPGSTHVAHYQTQKSSDASVHLADDPIKNPTNLSRNAQESICAQCHLQGDEVVDASDRTIWDYRPGDDLADYRKIYEFSSQEPNSEEVFVGHFGQLWQSKCYLGSDALTCITCHDPHHTPKPTELNALRKQQCLQCHTDDACSVPHEVRIRDEQDRCVACHMPAITSEVVHSATTNHRIGIHRQDATQDASIATGEQREHVDDPSVRRIATPESDGEERDSTTRSDLLANSLRLLNDLTSQGKSERMAELDSLLASLSRYAAEHVDDSSIHVVLAQLAYQKLLFVDMTQDETATTWELARSYATKALANASISRRDQLRAWEVLAAWNFDSGNIANAKTYYQRLTTGRRSASDFYNLGLCLGKQQDFLGAEMAFRQAIHVNNEYPLPYRSLSILYRQTNPELSRMMVDIAEFLTHRVNH
tara:strand:+ start:5967 stop:7958 length:1992 start_codon:yes stop_codon:yes gene_type:complete